LKGKDWFVRAYSMYDYGGNAFEIGSVGNAMQNARINSAVPASSYANNYFSAWQQIYNLARGNGGASISNVLQPDFNGGSSAFTIPTIQGGQSVEQAAKLAFDLTKGLQVPVGSKLFNDLRSTVASSVGDGISLNGTLTKGAAFLNTARYNDFSAQKNWTLKHTNLVIGGSYRSYLLKSDGTLFSDGAYTPLNFTEKRNKITNSESGIYGLAQQTIEFNQNKLIFSAAGRLDNFKNFGTRFSPRLSGVFNIKDKHALRLNYSTAFRQPAQLDQFIYLDYGTVILIGNVNGGFKGLNAAGTAPITVNPLKPEQMRTWEIGYKGYPLDYLSIDLSYYRSNYDDFIGIIRFNGREDGVMPTGDFIKKDGDWAKPATDRTRGRFIQTWANFDKTVTTQGFVMSAEYFQHRFVRPYFNYTWAKISEVKDLIAGWNTPTHKFNLGANGLIINNLTYSVNYRWNSTYNYFMPFDEGEIKAFGALDAQLNYPMKTWKTTFKLGGTNLTNANAVYVYGSAPITRMVYVGAVLDL
jgi:outer membrane receptor protein involved in Fe transport